MNKKTIGDSVKLSVLFLDRDDMETPVETTNVTFKVFDNTKTQIGTTVNITSENQIGTGNYEYIYTIPNKLPYIDVEWSGVNGDYTNVSRDRIYTTWSEEDTSTEPDITLTVGTNTYIDLSDANEYMTTSLNSDNWFITSDSNKKKALIQATKNIDRSFFKGSKCVIGQTLQFPRYYFAFWENLYTTSNTVPQEVLDACCEEALELINGKTDNSSSERIKLQNAGVLSIRNGDSYETYVSGRKRYNLCSEEALFLLDSWIAKTNEVRR